MSGFTISGRDASLLREISATACLVEDTPLPWQLLEQIKALVHGDSVEFNELDTIERYHPMWQLIAADGYRAVDAETPDEAMGSEFWKTYWTGPCSYPDRTGDFGSVTLLSDFVDLAEARRMGEFTGEMNREIMAYLPGHAPGRHLRLLIKRSRGSDFTDRERFYLTLLRPHLEQAYWSGVRRRVPKPDLTPRQFMLLALVRDGHTNLQIAHRLGLSEGTVRTHLNNIYKRLQVTNRTAAVTKVHGGVDELLRSFSP